MELINNLANEFLIIQFFHMTDCVAPALQYIRNLDCFISDMIEHIYEKNVPELKNFDMENINTNYLKSVIDNYRVNKLCNPKNFNQTKLNNLLKTYFKLIRDIQDIPMTMTDIDSKSMFYKKTRKNIIYECEYCPTTDFFKYYIIHENFFKNSSDTIYEPEFVTPKLKVPDLNFDLNVINNTSFQIEI